MLGPCDAMDREEAIRLLRGGEDGVREWNQRRGRGEEIPDLRRADLRGAVLYGAVLRQADLIEAHLRRAVLRGAKDLTQAQIESARGDVHTELPEGMVRPANWVDPPLPPLLPPQADNP